ncbi:MAG: hypothetical protein LBM12_01035 [Candidatus Nomurabacteria bacterium]|jgi:hypothetical protein|nr:hypothetical protein [Candidatus Nomurabacteria bacterium]
MKILKTKFTDTLTYKLRYVWLYIIVGALLLGAVIAMPELTGMRLSDAERTSALTSASKDLHLANFPYHLLQGLSISMLGMTPLAVKLPSIVLGIITAILITLLLNRWYRNLTAFITTALIVSSVAFLTLTGSGTPTILYLLFPVLMLWLGSQIIDEKPKVLTVVALSAAAIISVFIPYMIYFDLALFLLVFAHPHLRFSLYRLPRRAIIIAILAAAVAIVPLFLFVPGVNFNEFLLPHFQPAESSLGAWRQIIGLNEPLSWFSLPLLALMLVGAYATFLDYHIARNQIVFALILISLLASLFFPPLFTTTVLLAIILIGNGLGFLIKNWRGIFPNNIYAALVAALPLAAFTILAAATSINFFYTAPRTIAAVHYEANNDLQLLQENISEKDQLVLVNFTEFYAQAFPDNATYADFRPENLTASRVISDRPLTTDRRLEKIITSSSATQAARFYIYK